MSDNAPGKIKSFSGFVQEYMSDYELRGDGGDYCPSEQEKLIALDIIMGLVDWEGFGAFFVDKSIADKAEQFQTAVAYSCGHDYGYEKAKKEMEEILKPLRDVQEIFKMDMTKFDEVMTGAHDNEDYCEYGPMIEYVYSMIRAIKETLELAKKAGVEID
jgi:hypothetical protein